MKTSESSLQKGCVPNERLDSFDREPHYALSWALGDTAAEKGTPQFSCLQEHAVFFYDTCTTQPNLLFVSEVAEIWQDT
jgi:hypothetical protein